jgi:putative oxidoreductase
MTPLSALRQRYETVALSLVLAGVFTYAGSDKIRDPLQFVDSVAAFGMLPNALLTPFALGLPVFEILCGLMVLAPPTRRIGALALTLIIAMFVVALVSALARGLTLDCGCFGAGAPSRPRMWFEAALDVGLFAVALLVYLRSRVRPRGEELTFSN